jgi:hypothetical protein
MAVVNTSRTFNNNEQITSTKLNQIMDESSFISDAIVPNQGLQITAGGKMQVPNSGITTALIGDDQVITSKIPDSAVTAEKLASSLDLSSKTITLPNNSVTAEKLNGAQTGSAPIFGCRAYGSFNGQATSPISPIASGNVSTIVRLDTGIYRITMTTSMSSSNYTVVTSAKHAISDTYGTSCDISIVSESQFDIITGKVTGGNTYNSENVNFAVFQ